MQIGDLVKIWLNAEYSEVGIIIRVDRSTLPEKVYVQTSAGRLIEDWEDNCEVISAVK
jgi:hypothetical protein|tara:strand:+ start:423 stop:596 length:174 start_codon:yes stop_codon:yes gene_type:complete